MNPQAILTAALVNRFTRASFNTLGKHDKAGRFNRDAALRLLRNNVRDVAPDATQETQQRVAIALLTHWRTRAIVATHQPE